MNFQIPGGFQRLNKLPLDSSSVFYDFSALHNHISGANSTAYAGQTCSLVTQDSNKLYLVISGVVENTLELKEIGLPGDSPLAGGESIVYTTGDQSIAGDKNFLGNLTVNSENVVTSDGTVNRIVFVDENLFDPDSADPATVYLLV